MQTHFRTFSKSYIKDFPNHIFQITFISSPRIIPLICSVYNIPFASSTHCHLQSHIHSTHIYIPRAPNALHAPQAPDAPRAPYALLKSRTHDRKTASLTQLAAAVTQKLACRSGPSYVGALSPVSPRLQSPATQYHTSNDHARMFTDRSFNT